MLLPPGFESRADADGRVGAFVSDVYLDGEADRRHVNQRGLSGMTEGRATPVAALIEARGLERALRR